MCSGNYSLGCNTYPMEKGIEVALASVNLAFANLSA